MTRAASKPQTVAAWQRGRQAVAVKGAVRVVHPVLRRLGVTWQWDARLGVYVIPLHDVDRLLVAVEMAGHRVDYRTALW